MQTFTAHRLRFITEAQSTIELNEHQGSAIRGSLFHALRNRFCGNQKAQECAACPLVATCPVATLVSTLRPESGRGRDVPRPYTVQPPILNSERRMANGESEDASEPGDGALGHPFEDERGRLFFHYEPGERFEFGLTLYAQALQLFPYVVLTTKTFEDQGIGRRMERNKGRWRRGTLVIQEVWEENPLTGERQSVIQADDGMVQVPDIPITHEQVCEWANERIANNELRMGMRFLTPTRVVEHGRLVKPHQFSFKPLFQRLLDRLESLSRDFSDTKLDVDFTGLVEAAERVRVVENHLRWEELRSYSTRRRAESPTSGFVGSATLEADDWSPFLPWLAWGQFTHVGKDAVKGNGWYVLNGEWANGRMGGGR